MPSTTIKFTDTERAALDRLRKKYGTVRNTVVSGLRALERVERGQLVTRPADGDAPPERQSAAGP